MSVRACKWSPPHPSPVRELAEWTLAVQFFSVTFLFFFPPKSGLKLSLFLWPDKMDDDVGWVFFLPFFFYFYR